MLKITAYEAGQALRWEIFKNGIGQGAISQIRQILNNHSQEEKVEFLKGLIYSEIQP